MKQKVWELSNNYSDKFNSLQEYDYVDEWNVKESTKKKRGYKRPNSVVLLFVYLSRRTHKWYYVDVKEFELKDESDGLVFYSKGKDTKEIFKKKCDIAQEKYDQQEKARLQIMDNLHTYICREAYPEMPEDWVHESVAHGPFDTKEAAMFTATLMVQHTEEDYEDYYKY
jgi:hypothetical protein